MIYIIIALAFFILPSLLLLYMYKLARTYSVTEEIITLPITMKNKRMLFISDIHYRVLDKEMFKRFPSLDYVIIGGDLAEAGVNEENVHKNLSVLSGLGKVYFVWGNNDYEFGEERLKAILLKWNVILLENESCIFEEKGFVWNLAGVEDLSTERTEMEQALNGTKGPTIIISHNPEAVRLIEDRSNIIAMLSGHTHGGQIRIGPFGIAERGGWKTRNNTNLFISNGYGTTGLHLRLGAYPQIHLFTIKGE